MGNLNIFAVTNRRRLVEAKAYLAHPILSTRLQEICEAALAVGCSDAGIVFGSPDDLKLRSSMTPSEQAAPEDQVFGMVLDKFSGRERDELALQYYYKQEVLYGVFKIKGKGIRPFFSKRV